MEKKDIYSRVRLANENDAELIWQWRNHPEVRKWMFNQNEINFKDHKVWLYKKLNSTDNVLLIYINDNIEYGFINFNNLIGNIWEWGFYIMPDSPKGTGKHMGKCAIQYAFDIMHADKLFGQVLENNERSIRLHEYLGFKKEGCLRQHILLDGKYHDIYLFGLLKN
ncbi:UDP-4-amino-4,6-dideoxy-N-acetyl-beta-L-altrosamine N-acetyltransferase [Pectobacterium brasiliense]|uniref:UDP-4-amino-4, 6-dideoxy-N-acetyl-beta-L-altrosamine N-acetyltransferase n=1 Tax=Pectobacterium brasiliense TaxID=180957 RepID=A0AAE2WC93_9GAMM|nr:UDP-4-amino-4,6-dideoxy-N-acetyl-beta-L-altrosamine N-acetyltransferase [Pectobacterium brasiliense]MBN3050255.1 UDP-4-amino-4,6-dideoxy-N-acetyl-beta-L-altrosamine N-acetyltransferase [Pectobacterium brasiliense]